MAQSAAGLSHVAAVVLAAGAGTRFGGAKLLASLGGKPLLQHVLDALAETMLDKVLVVLGHGADEIERAIRWRAERRIRNPDPDRGLSSSLRLGLASLARTTQAALVLLGDQPQVRQDVIRALLARPPDGDHPFTAARYPADAAPNPVFVHRSAWAMAGGLEGEHGFGSFLRDRPELVRWVDVAGENPDVDTRADLALLEWAARVRANREQVDRFREVPDGPDFYGPVSSLFRSDPNRTDDPVLDVLLTLARPDEIWLDIGAGAGRFALPLALRVREVIALDHSPSMLAALRELASEHLIANVRTIEAAWPPDPDALPALPGARLSSDVSLIAHVGYDIEAIGPFLDAMEGATRRLCVAVLMERTPATIAEPFWPPVHGEERVPLPALPEFLDLLRVRGSEPEVRIAERKPREFSSRDELERFIRRQLWVGEGTAKERRMHELLAVWTIETEEGVGLRDQRPMVVGVVTWVPAGRPGVA